jgi:hypothetical protein
MNPVIQAIVAISISLAALLLLKPVAAADAGSCYVITDADARTACLAKARKEPGMCYAVQRADLRAQCLAEARK